MDFPERDFEFDSSETSDNNIEEEEGDIVEAWLSGQTWYLLAGLLMGFVFNMVRWGSLSHRFLLISTLKCVYLLTQA